MGGLPGSTSRRSAVAPVPAELLSILREGPATLPTRLVRALTVLILPGSKRAPTPVPAIAVEASPTVRASRTAKPIIVAVPLPSHQILARIVFVIFVICTLSFLIDRCLSSVRVLFAPAPCHATCLLRSSRTSLTPIISLHCLVSRCVNHHDSSGVPERTWQELAI